MARFNITVDLDFMEEDGSIDEELWEAVRSEIVFKAAKAVSDKMMKEIEDAVSGEVGGINTTIGTKLNQMMEEFFNEPRDITDRYGDVVKKGVCVRDQLKASCDNFLDQKVDSNGNPSDSWSAKQTRLQYIIGKAVDYSMQHEIKSAVDKVVKSIKDNVADIINHQMSEKLRSATGIDEIIGKL